MREAALIATIRELEAALAAAERKELRRRMKKERARGEARGKGDGRGRERAYTVNGAAPGVRRHSASELHAGAEPLGALFKGVSGHVSSWFG